MIFLVIYIYVLFAGWEARPLAAFSRPRSQYFTIRTDLKLANNILTFVIESGGAPSTIDRSVKNLPNERITQILDKGRCIKNKYFSTYVMVVAFMSPVKFSNIVLPV